MRYALILGLFLFPGWSYAQEDPETFDLFPKNLPELNTVPPEMEVPAASVPTVPVDEIPGPDSGMLPTAVGSVQPVQDPAAATIGDAVQIQLPASDAAAAAATPNGLTNLVEASTAASEAADAAQQASEENSNPATAGKVPLIDPNIMMQNPQ